MPSSKSTKAAASPARSRKPDPALVSLFEKVQSGDLTPAAARSLAAALTDLSAARIVKLFPDPPSGAQQAPEPPPAPVIVQEAPEPAKATPATQAAPQRSWIFLLIILLLSGAAYRFRDRLSSQASPDTRLAAEAVQRHSQLVRSEIIDQLRSRNDGNLTNTQALEIIKVAHPVISRQTWSPLADRLTQLQELDKDGKPTGKMSREPLSRFLDDCEKGIP